MKEGWLSEGVRAVGWGGGGGNAVKVMRLDKKT